MPDLAADIARRVKKDSKATVPPGGATGRVLTKTGPGDYDTGWQLAARLPTGGAVGDVLTKTALPDGAAGWAAPAGAGGGFPVGPEDDGTATYEITAASLVQKASTVVNGTGENAYVATGANTSVQQASLQADDNAGDTANISALVASGSPQIVLATSDGTYTNVLSAQGQALGLSSQGPSGSDQQADIFTEVYTTVGSPFTTDGPRTAAHSVVNANTNSVTGISASIELFAVGASGDSAGADSGAVFFEPIYMTWAPGHATPTFPDDIDSAAGAKLVLYAFDNAGSTELRCKFANGTVVTLATD